MGKESTCNARDAGDSGSIPGLGQSPWKGEWRPTPVFLPGEIPWTEHPGRLQSIALQRQTRLNLLSTHAHLVFTMDVQGGFYYLCSMVTFRQVQGYPACEPEFTFRFPETSAPALTTVWWVQPPAQREPRKCMLKTSRWDFPGGPVAKTPCTQRRRPRFDPWSGN